MQITRGKITGAQKVVIYGPEGIGKSTFAAQFPNPLFIDTEGSTKHMDVARTPKPTSWAMLLEQVRYVRDHQGICGTLVIDTADWAEQLCAVELCAKSKKSGLEDFGYGKGYVYLTEEFGRLLNLLEEVVERGTNVCFTAHAKMRKFEQPDEMGAYDRWEVKLQKSTGPLLKEWADMMLFANYKTYVVNVDGQGVQKGKNKVQGGDRVLYTTHHPCWDAKNRHDLPDEIPMRFAAISHCIPAPDRAPDVPPAVQQAKADMPKSTPPVTPEPTPEKIQESDAPPPEVPPTSPDSGLPRALLDLMRENKVTKAEIQGAVSARGYYPSDTPIGNYEPDFIAGVLVGAWPQVYQMILSSRQATDQTTPF